MGDYKWTFSNQCNNTKLWYCQIVVFIAYGNDICFIPFIVFISNKLL